MKTNLLLIAAIFTAITNSMATVHTVSAGGMAFTPANGVTMHPGDTIMWVWTDGVHTTTSTNIPPGATPWNRNLRSDSVSFMYVPTILGTYSYQCNFHVSMGMIGSFSVISATGINTVSDGSVFKVYPNPATGTAHIHFNRADVAATVILTDVNGRQMLRRALGKVKETDLDLSTIPNGTYIITVEQNNVANRQDLIVNHKS